MESSYCGHQIGKHLKCLDVFCSWLDHLLPGLLVINYSLLTLWDSMVKEWVGIYVMQQHFFSSSIRSAFLHLCNMVYFHLLEKRSFPYVWPICKPSCKMGNGNRNMTIEATNILFFFLVLVIKMKIAILHKLSETTQNAKKILAFKYFFYIF